MGVQKSFSFGTPEYNALDDSSVTLMEYDYVNFNEHFTKYYKKAHAIVLYKCSFDTKTFKKLLASSDKLLLITINHCDLNAECLETLFSTKGLVQINIKQDKLDIPKLDFVFQDTLKLLSINQCEFDPAILDSLSGNLALLDLDGSSVNDDFIKHLVEVINNKKITIKYLSIMYADITDAALESLSKTNNISSINIRFTKCSPAAIEKYRGEKKDVKLYTFSE
jgi:hypothetical protein